MFLRAFLAALAAIPAFCAPIDDFFARFSEQWVRRDPMLATATQYFKGAEQQKLDRDLGPFSEQEERETIALARQGLAELRKFDKSKLSTEQAISAQVMEWQLQSIVAGEPFRQFSYPFRQFGGLQLGLTSFLTNIHPIRNQQDADNYIARLGQVGAHVDDGVAVARKRAAKGIVPPRFILTATISQMKRFIEPAPGSNLFVTTFADRMQKVDSIPAGTRKDFQAIAEKIVADSIYPAWRRAIAELESQLPKSTEQAGYWKFSNGAAIYRYNLRKFTTTSMTAEQIHEIGLKEVARIEKEAGAILTELGFRTGSVKDRLREAEQKLVYADSPNIRDEVLADYKKWIRDAEERSKLLFDVVPRAPVDVRRIPEYQEQNTPAHYTLPARDGSRPGIFWAPLAGPRFQRVGMRTLAYHEAVPGHHFQLALQQENTELPRFRTDGLLGILSAFAEGWGLYAERIADENHWYDGDPVGRLGYLSSELFRARRLVVDTGLHSKKWTRQQAIDYGISPLEVERYIVWPGQACSYKIGQLKILEIRDKARQTLGPKFNTKAFHNLVLRTGSVPLEVLEKVVDDWIRQSKS
ncbi:MAG: DUF885 domain-containing protein [Bryobacterales bacterium]|nr:DUF885 domain-containing protein [Bryobacterales bacterium]